MNAEDLRQMQSKGLGSKYMQTIGFRNFTSYMERKIKHMFVDSSGPVLTRLKELKQEAEKQERDLTTEFTETDPHRILSTTGGCAVSFASALTHAMEGVLDLKPVVTLEEELRGISQLPQGRRLYALRPPSVRRVPEPRRVHGVPSQRGQDHDLRRGG